MGKFKPVVIALIAGIAAVAVIVGAAAVGMLRPVPGLAQPDGRSLPTTGPMSVVTVPALPPATDPVEVTVTTTVNPPPPSSTPPTPSSSPVTPSSSSPPPPTTPSVAVPREYRHPLGWYGSGRVVTLTFDDGPGPWTPRVLDVLAAAGVKATFCQIGSQVGQFPELERRIVAEGHTLCSHSWDHDESLATRDVATMESDLRRTQQAISGAAGVTPGYYRAPAGNFGSDGALPGVLAKFGLRPLGWAVDSWDWRKPGVEKIVQNVVTNVSPGAIVLMHDAGGDRSQTLAALPRIISELHARGYRFITLPG